MSRCEQAFDVLIGCGDQEGVAEVQPVEGCPTSNSIAGDDHLVSGEGFAQWSNAKFLMTISEARV